MEINQKVFPVAGEPVLLEVGDGEGETVVDADYSGDVSVEFLAEPFGETTPSPVPAWTGWRLNLRRLVGTLGHEHAEPFATGFGRHRAGLVDADVAAKCWFQVQPPPCKLYSVPLAANSLAYEPNLSTCLRYHSFALAFLSLTTFIASSIELQLKLPLYKLQEWQTRARLLSSFSLPPRLVGLMWSIRKLAINQLSKSFSPSHPQYLHLNLSLS